MKNKYILAFLFVMGLSTSCKKFLDTEPTDFYTPSNYYETAAQLQVGLNGIYSNMMYGPMYGQVLNFNFTSATDEMLPNISVNGDNRGLYYSYDAGHNNVAGVWRWPYIGINNANVLLDNINKPTMNEKERGYIKGQALFLRAFNYFILTTHFGGVPIVLHSPGIADTNIPAASQVEVYEQIVADLKEVAILLKGRTASNLGYNDQVTITAVHAMLARVYLHWAGFPTKDVSKYADVIVYADSVINSGLHDLNPDYKQVFINLCQDKYDVKENILEWGSAGAAAGVANKGGNDIGNFVGINSSLYFVNNVPDPSSYLSAGWVSITKKLFDSYEVVPTSTLVNKASLDTRRDWNCADYIYAINNGTSTRYKLNRNNPWQMPCGKFRREYCPQEIRINGSYNINWPVIRYSDVLLMKAEAENQVNGPTTAAYDAINLVRKRGYGTMYGNIVKDITVENGGSGYSTANPPEVTISGGGGSGATGIAIVSGGKVTGVKLTSRGSLTTSGPYFSSAPTVTIAAPTTGVTATATATITNGTEYLLTPGLSKADFQLAVRDERMRELCFEAYRRTDLVRWGNFVGDMREFANYASANGISVSSTGNPNGYQGISGITSRHLLLPKPTYELNLNKALVQNPGY
ncbi:RagB/SusD family nutrient uptake outer membrane protein [Pedobacter endophyticus]|uniref:RagB/SusD family nutrient uptake outer membrane protein n=1 Tax=Pedobacter endophyticus TaxID=2789740 RepID=A0A7S9KY58_9SPHI|nr:RagB/SusD family nutrient uptake outer membrane protein [Pedobacter endophyticus]QPH38982.1 RagB/SusD family nutrient uptake outer membrane protein [Pedobacter endophyticus]